MKRFASHYLFLPEHGWMKQMVVEIENHFDITLPDKECSNFRTVNDIIKTTNKILEN